MFGETNAVLSFNCMNYFKYIFLQICVKLKLTAKTCPLNIFFFKFVLIQ